MDEANESGAAAHTTPADAPVPPPLRRQRLLAGLTGEETSRRWSHAATTKAAVDVPRIVKRTYELEEAVVAGVRRQATVLGVNANDLANALLKDGLAAIAAGTLQAEVGILPEDELRGPRAAARHITALHRAPTGTPRGDGKEG